MKCQDDIEALAEDKLTDAELLFQNKRYDAAYFNRLCYRIFIESQNLQNIRNL